MSVSGDQDIKPEPMDDFMEADDNQQPSREADEKREDTNEGGDVQEASENKDAQPEEDDKQDEKEDEMRSKRVFVGNLSFKTSTKLLKEYMLKIGDVSKVDIFEDKNGNSKGFGLVEFVNAEDAKKAIAEMNQTSLDGRQIFVREDNAKQNRPGPLLVKERKTQRRNGSPRRSDSRRRRHSRSRSRSGGRDKRHGDRRRRRSRSKSRSRSYSPRHNRRSGRDDHERRRERSRSRDERRRSRSRSKDRNRRSRSRERERDNRKGGQAGHQVIVKNMPWSVTWQQLKDAFKEYGSVLRADVPQDGSGRSKGYGYVKFEKEAEALKAIGD